MVTYRSFRKQYRGIKVALYLWFLIMDAKRMYKTGPSMWLTAILRHLEKILPKHL